MTLRLEVRESEIGDVYRLAANLRDGDRAEAVALSFDPARAIRLSYRDAILRRSYLVDGELAAMSGLCGALLSDIGQPYLMTTPAAERAKLSFLKLARAAVDEMLCHRLRLEGHVAVSYTRAIRLLNALGFDIATPQPLGPHSALFCAFVRTRLA